MSKYYCRSCGNTLFFRKIIDGHIAIPLEVEDCDDINETISYKSVEFREIYHSYIECGECGCNNVEENETLRENDEQV